MSSHNVIFLFSLPRSGSSLLQRLLGTHPEISSRSESWIGLVPFLPRHPNWSKSVVNSVTLEKALSGVEKSVGSAEYTAAARCFLDHIYSKQSEGKRFVLDKTPRYYLVIDELMQTFPDAKAIFLFRDPAAVLNSILKTWHSGRLTTVHRSWVDIVEGPILLSLGYERHAHRSIAVSYESLVTDPSSSLREIAQYLHIPYEFDFHGYERSTPEDELGDRRGIGEYKGVSVMSVEKWAKEVDSKARRTLLLRYLRHLESSASGFHSRAARRNREIALPLRPKRLGLKDLLQFLVSFWYLRVTTWLQRRTRSENSDQIAGIMY